MDTPRTARTGTLHSFPLLSLESRLGLLRRRRRRTYLKAFASIGPVLVGMSLLLLAALGGMASFR